MASEFQPPPTYQDVVIIDEKTQKARFNPIWLNWFISLAQVISDSGGGGGGALDHNSLSGLQGGGAGERYHFTNSEHTTTLVLVGEEPALSTLAGEEPALSALAAVTPISQVVVLAKITGGGANGSATFVNGLLTNYVAPT